MGTTKRAGTKPAKKAMKVKLKLTKRPKVPVPAPPAAGLNPLLLDDADALATELAALLAQIATQAEEPAEDGVYPQRAMQACLRLERIGKRISQPISAACAALYAGALQHRQDGGAFEPGSVNAVFPTTGGRRSPRWKGEAIAQAERRAGLEHGIRKVVPEAQRQIEQAAAKHVFDPKVYEATVLDATEPGPVSTAVKFEEAAA